MVLPFGHSILGFLPIEIIKPSCRYDSKYVCCSVTIIYGIELRWREHVYIHASTPVFSGEYHPSPHVQIRKFPNLIKSSSSIKQLYYDYFKFHLFLHIESQSLSAEDCACSLRAPGDAEQPAIFASLLLPRRGASQCIETLRLCSLCVRF